ncbi:unnamed protein product [Peronospora belbahrii]|uniref:BHLH domain-containing protein n=1 Tax=Peronospora belbahrii TaxID=622444 RepID=A0AAU9KUD7_9STRA|nr:unnamed protein product [Peronospora belbahrii]
MKEKKKRAKINRKDVNSRFQELMDILQLKEDRKLNRAKSLEKTIEHIAKLTAELGKLKTRHGPRQQQGIHPTYQAGMGKTPSLVHHPHQLSRMTSAMAHSMGQHNFVGSVRGTAVGDTMLLPYKPSRGHSWRTTRLPLAPMVWMPCSVVTSAGMLLTRSDLPARPADTSSRKRGREESVEVKMTAASVAELTEVLAISSSIRNESSVFKWSAHAMLTLLSYCDAWTLMSVMRTSCKLKRAASSEKLWGDLCRSRWRISPQVSIPHPFEHLHK